MNNLIARAYSLEILKGRSPLQKALGMKLKNEINEFKGTDEAFIECSLRLGLQNTMANAMTSLNFLSILCIIFDLGIEV